MPVDLTVKTHQEDHPCLHRYARNLQESLRIAYEQARKNINTTHKRQKEVYDHRVHGNLFEPGKLVWLHQPHIPLGQSRKLHNPWTGPYKVIERLAESTYRIRHLSKHKRIHVVHFDRLKPCTPGMRSEPLSNKQIGTPPPSKSYGDRLIAVPEYSSALESEDEPPNAQGTLDHHHLAVTVNIAITHQIVTLLVFLIKECSREFQTNSKKRGSGVVNNNSTYGTWNPGTTQHTISNHWHHLGTTDTGHLHLYCMPVAPNVCNMPSHLSYGNLIANYIKPLYDLCNRITDDTRI